MLLHFGSIVSFANRHDTAEAPPILENERLVKILKRECVVENKDLIKKQKKLKRKNFLSNLIIVILIIVAVYLGIQGYTNQRDSWFFKNIVNTEANTAEPANDEGILENQGN